LIEKKAQRFERKFAEQAVNACPPHSTFDVVAVPPGVIGWSVK
jgi:hypothetical protein